MLSPTQDTRIGIRYLTETDPKDENVYHVGVCAQYQYNSKWRYSRSCFPVHRDTRISCPSSHCSFTYTAVRVLLIYL
jgi:hypothetical protein